MQLESISSLDDVEPESGAERLLHLTFLMDQLEISVASQQPLAVARVNGVKVRSESAARGAFTHCSLSLSRV